MKRFAILGGGISGLSAAWKLSTSSQAEIVVVERNDHVGGWIQSKRTDHGSVFELGPRSLRTAGLPGKQTLNLVSLRQYMNFVFQNIYNYVKIIVNSKIYIIVCLFL